MNKKELSGLTGPELKKVIVSLERCRDNAQRILDVFNDGSGKMSASTKREVKKVLNFSTKSLDKAYEEHDLVQLATMRAKRQNGKSKGGMRK
jgi:hypothetical protein